MQLLFRDAAAKSHRSDKSISGPPVLEMSLSVHSRSGAFLASLMNTTHLEKDMTCSCIILLRTK